MWSIVRNAVPSVSPPPQKRDDHQRPKLENVGSEDLPESISHQRIKSVQN